jgi:archaeal flagellin FlaB
MNLMKDEHDHSHRGIIGLESTLIIIAFVIVAAALAFVVLNMGFSTAQKAKTAIGSTLSSTGGTLEVEGKVIASSFRPPGGTPSLNVTSVPIKIALSGDSVNFDPSITAVKYLSNQITYDDIYAGTLNAAAGGPTFSSLETATAGALAANYIDVNPFADAGWPTSTAAFTYWSVQSNTNDILEAGEHASLVIVFAASDRPEYLDKIRVELILAGGATLTVERAVPQIYNEVVDLG